MIAETVGKLEINITTKHKSSCCRPCAVDVAGVNPEGSTAVTLQALIPWDQLPLVIAAVHEW
mgnify:FL=1